MASVSDSGGTETSIKPPRRGPAIVSSDSEDDSEPEYPPRHLRAPSKTPSWAKSVSRSPSPIVHRGRRGGTRRDVSPELELWADGSEQGYGSAESGRIRLRMERSSSVLRGGESGSDGEASSESGVGSDGSDVEDSEDEIEGHGESKAHSAIEKQLSSDNIIDTGQILLKRQGGSDQDLQLEAESQAEESEGDKDALDSDPEDSIETEPEVEADSEVEASPEVEAKSGVGVEPGAEIESESEAASEIENKSAPLDGSESEEDIDFGGGPGPDPEEEAVFADESQLETQPTYEPLPSLLSRANYTKSSGPATPSPSDTGSDTEEGSTPFVTPNEHPIAPPDSPSPSEYSGADSEDEEDEYKEDEDEEDEYKEDEDEEGSTSAETPLSDLQSRRKRTTTKRAPKISGRRRGKQIDKYNPRYLELLNDHIALAASRGLGELKHDRDRVTPVLGSAWTRLERDMFFKYLAIVGKDDVAELSRLIGTKSVVECRAYIKALQDGREHDWHAPARRWAKGRDIVSSKDIPAAVELSDECVEALEEEADALEERTLKDEERREKWNWGDLWRLDATSSWAIEQLYKENNIEEIHQIAPEAELLNSYNMLELSESIFMNGSGNDQNWQSFGSDPPAIRHVAFKDLHTLVVSLTRRIVQTTIYMATSRLRGMESKVFSKKKLIRPIDVEAAVNCLNLPENSREFWVKTPRRIGLHVYNRKEDVRRRSDKNFIPYDELEQVLRSTRKHGSGSGVNSGDYDGEDDDAVEAKMDAFLAAAYVERDNNDEGIKDGVFDLKDTTSSGLNSERDMDDDDDESHESSSSDIDVDGTFRSKPQKKTDVRLESIDNAEDIYLEALDKKRSYKEEKALWELMGREPINPLPNIKKPLPKLLPQERKRPLELVNWRDSAGYLASWETDKKRKTEHHGGLWVEDEKRSTASHSAATFSKPQTATEAHKHEVVPKKKKKKKKKPMVKKQKREKPISPIKAMSPTAQRPRRLRERRQSKMYSGFVSTVDNIIETDQEALARELQDDGSSSQGDSD